MIAPTSTSFTAKPQNCLSERERDATNSNIFCVGPGQCDQLESERIRSFEHGLPRQWATAVQLTFSLSDADLADFLGVAPPDVLRPGVCKPFKSAEAERLDRLAAITLRASSTFDSFEAAVRWMVSPNQALGGIRPVMKCRTEIGANQVRRILQAIEWGGCA
ncbi:antitoxin Xre/MbcA/ParS toxin-binding domain-containing protein [Pseudomonas cavernicola]